MKNADQIPKDASGSGQQEGDSDEWEDEDEIPIGDILDLAGQTNALFLALMISPEFNKTDPMASPKPLFFTADFVRRTYLEYILPLLPAEAPYKAGEIANPFLFDYTPEKPMPTESNRSFLENIENYPETNEELLYDAVGRNVLVSLGILEAHQAGSKGALMLGGQYEFGEQAKEVATMIAGGQEEKKRIMAQKGIQS